MKTPPDMTHALMRKRCSRSEPGTLCTSGLLGRWRALSGHLRHARLANRLGLWLRRSSRNWPQTGSLCRPAHGEGVSFGAGTGGGGLLPQTAASGNVSQPDPESLMKYPG